MEFLTKLGESFGLVGVFGGAIIMLLFFVVKWTLATTKDILKQSAEERKCWQDVILKFTSTIENHNQQAMSFHNSMIEAARYNRSEHEKILTGLIEVEKSLSQMNGK